jgi:hypothetical protein
MRRTLSEFNAHNTERAVSGLTCLPLVCWGGSTEHACNPVQRVVPAFLCVDRGMLRCDKALKRSVEPQFARQSEMN